MSRIAGKPTNRAAELERLVAMSDERIDTSDIPERLDWSEAQVGRFYRPIKRSVTIRLDADVLEWFKSNSGKYQSRINEVLRQFMLEQREETRPTTKRESDSGGARPMGEAIAAKLRDAGIRTFGELAAKTPEQLRGILGRRPQVDPADVIAQAKRRPPGARLN